MKVKNCWHHSSYADAIALFVTRKSEKLMKIVNIDKENLHIFWTIWITSMKFLGKKWLIIIIIILKIKKKIGALPSRSRRCIFGKAKGGGGRGKNSTMGKIQLPFFMDFLLLLRKLSFWGEDWALGYNSMRFWDFPDIS